MNMQFLKLSTDIALESRNAVNNKEFALKSDPIERDVGN